MEHDPSTCLLGVPDAVLEGLLLVDQRGDELGRVDLAAAHLGEVRRALREDLAGESFEVLDHARP